MPTEPTDPVDTSAHQTIWFERAGARLHATVRGEGTPLVLLHGGLADHRACWLYAQPLVERHRVITPDLRGAGRSHFRGALDWELIADDLAALLDRLGLERATIGGASFGAAAALAFALRHLPRVTVLVLLAPAYAGADVGLTPAQAAAMAAMDAVGRRAPAEGVGVLHPLFAALPAPVQARARAMVDGFDAGSVAATTAFMASGAQPFATADELRALARPALVVPGTDPTHPRAVAEHLARHLPIAALVDADQPRWAETIEVFLGGPFRGRRPGR